MVTQSLSSEAVSGAPIDDQVADQLLAHLGAETMSMTGILNAVRGVHQALAQLDDAALMKSLEEESRELSTAREVQERRHRLQHEFAAVLHVAPNEVTLRRLASTTSGSLRESIEQGWQGLAKMASELERLNQQNAAMIGQSLALARGVVERMTGMVAVGESYNADGVRAETHLGPLIQWGG